MKLNEYISGIRTSRVPMLLRVGFEVLSLLLKPMSVQRQVGLSCSPVLWWAGTVVSQHLDGSPAGALCHHVHTGSLLVSVPADCGER